MWEWRFRCLLGNFSYSNSFSVLVLMLSGSFESCLLREISVLLNSLLFIAVEQVVSMMLVWIKELLEWIMIWIEIVSCMILMFKQWVFVIFFQFYNNFITHVNNKYHNLTLNNIITYIHLKSILFICDLIFSKHSWNCQFKLLRLNVKF